MLHGIELVEPDNWYDYGVACPGCQYNHQGHCIAQKDRCSLRHKRGWHSQVEGQPCELAGWEWLDPYIVPDLLAGWTVACGLTGCYIAFGSTPDIAAAKALAYLDQRGEERIRQRIIGFLEVAPLSPRYRWKGVTHDRPNPEPDSPHAG